MCPFQFLQGLHVSCQVVSSSEGQGVREYRMLSSAEKWAVFVPREGEGEGSDVGQKNSSRRNVARNFQLEILVHVVVSFLDSVKFTEIELWNIPKYTPAKYTVSPTLPQSLYVSNLPPTFGVAPTSGPAPTFGRNLYHF